MAESVAQMTPAELREMIEAVIDQKLREILVDPDEGLVVRKRVRHRLLKQRQAVSTGKRGRDLDEVARELGLE